MKKIAKGKRPIYFDDPQTDKLLAIIMAMAGEISVLRERLDTIEHLLESKGIVSITEIETYQADEKTIQQRDFWREAYLGRILRVLQDFNQKSES